MGKAGKWIKSFLIGGKKDKVDKVDKDKEKNTSTLTSTNKVVIPPPQSTPKEKKRWSFRRSSATAPKDSSSNESTPIKLGPPATSPSPEPASAESKKPGVTMASPDHSADTAESDSEENEKAIFVQEAAAATKIQSIFRSYLARKALRALRGLVKIQALVRGHLVRKQATVTLRCMQALVTAQARARAHRIKNNDFNFTNSSYNELESGIMEENIKIVEMDQGGESKIKKNYSNYHYAPQFDYIKQDYNKYSPAPSAITDISPRTCSGHFEDNAFATAQSSPQCYYSAVSRPDPSKMPFAFPRQDYPESLSYEYPLYPNYMANTKSSRAKARSQSAPKQRPETFERQLSRKRPSVEGRNIPKAVRMQRSSSHVGATAQNYQYPSSIRLDKSTVSLIESECGSNCSALTNANYCRTVISYDPQGNRY